MPPPSTSSFHQESSSGLTKLELREFRCFSSLRFEPNPGLNFLVGPNAQGKTSILEAACILLRLRSPRTSMLAEAVHFGATAFALDGHYGGRHLQLRSTPQATPKRILTLDGVKQGGTADYLTTGRVVWFGSDDLGMVSGSAERRRRFLDSAGLQLDSDYGKTLRFYEKALRSRNLLLREGHSRREIEAYDHPLAESGDQLMKFRSAICRSLVPRAADACRGISRETMTLLYQPGTSTPMPMMEALASSRSEESRLRQTQVGPHRDDLEILLEGNSAATFASEGQQRTIALALKLALAGLLAEGEARPPLLLLDDVFGELDSSRRNALLAGLPSGSQALLTTTDLGKMESPPGATLFTLNHGDLKQHAPA